MLSEYSMHTLIISLYTYIYTHHFYRIFNIRPLCTIEDFEVLNIIFKKLLLIVKIINKKKHFYL